MEEITGGHRYMGKVKITAEVVSQTCIATDIYSLILKAGEIASQAVARSEEHTSELQSR